MDYHHSHPINILEHTSRFLILLLLPVLRALYSLLFTNMNIYNWLKGAWFDIITLMAVIGLGFITWFRYIYRFEDNGIRFQQGIIIIKKRFIPYKNLSVLSIERPFYLLPFGAVRVNADTDGGLPTLPDFKITIHKKELSTLLFYSQIPFIDHGDIKRVYLTKNIYIAVLSFITSNSLTGVLYVSTLISGCGKILGEQVERRMVQQISSLASFFAFGIHPAAATAAFIVLGGWLVSFLINAIRHLRFFSIRQGSRLDIQSGIITCRRYLIAVKRINLIEMRQSLITKLFGIYTAFIHSNGYGKKKDELSVLIPASSRYDLSQNIELLLPEIPLCKKAIRPKAKQIIRFLIPPLIWITVISLLWFSAFIEFDYLGDLILYIGIMALIPCIWYLFVKIASFFHTGIGSEKDSYTFFYTYGYRFKTITVPKQKIIKLTIRQSLFQKMSDSCDLIVLTFSEGRKRHVIPSLDVKEVQNMIGIKNSSHKKHI